MPTDNEYDLVIVGGGPAGMAAAIYGSRMGWKTLVLEKSSVGGLAATTPLIENYPGIIEITGIDFSEKLRKQAERFGTEIHELVEVIDIKTDKRPMEVITTEGTYTAKVVIIGTGTHHRRLNIPGEEEYEGMGVSYCATCDGNLFKNKDVIVVGGGNSAVTEALYLDNVVKKVYLIHRRDRLRAETSLQKQLFENSNVEIIWNSIVKEIRGKGERGVRSVVIETKKEDGTVEESILKVRAVFVAIGIIPNNELAKKIGLKLNENGYILVDREQRTNIPYIYAVGDITPGQGQIAVAVAEGTTAAITAFLDMKGGDWYGQDKVD